MAEKKITRTRLTEDEKAMLQAWLKRAIKTKECLASDAKEAIARQAQGALPIESVKPSHVRNAAKAAGIKLVDARSVTSRRNAGKSDGNLAARLNEAHRRIEDLTRRVSLLEGNAEVKKDATEWPSTLKGGL